MSPPQQPDRDGPGRRVMLIGRGMNDLVTRAPWLWPVLRRPMRSYFDGLAGDWDERTASGSAESLAAIAAGLLHVKPAPERALDVGTGTGVVALLVAREFPQARVRGIDVSEEMIATAKDKVGLDPEGRIAFKTADASAIPWPDESFDLVTQMNVPPFFGELARILRPGGTVVAASSNGERTPFYTPNSVFQRSFSKLGVREVNAGDSGRGTYWVGRKDA